MLVCLDAGHGKETAGKRAFDESFFEYEFNRDVVRRIKPLLEEVGVDVILTAPTDEDVTLYSRCKVSNDAKADVFISIHANAFGTTWNDANGWSIFRHTGSTKGLALCLAIQSESIPFLGLRDRGINEANFYVLKNTIAPAALIEHGFFTNVNELYLLKSDSFRQKCAVADARGILKYLGVPFEEADYKVMYEEAMRKYEVIKMQFNAIYSKIEKVKEIING